MTPTITLFLVIIPLAVASVTGLLLMQRHTYLPLLGCIAVLVYNFQLPSSETPVFSLFGWGVNAQATQSWWEIAYASTILVVMLATFVTLMAYWMFKPEKSQKNNRATNGANDLATHEVALPRYTFADVDGMDDLKADLNEVAESVMSGKKNGVLFTGLPGNGKTFISEAFAGEIAKMLKKGKRLGFMSVSMKDMASRWTNQTTEQLDSLFKQAASVASQRGACFLFIDEIDSILPDRKNILDGASEKSQQVNAMLTLLVQYRDFTKYGIIIAAATNHRDRLDEAAIREGRFDFKREIKTPDLKARVGLLTRSAKQAVIPAQVAARAAGRWEGFGVARIRHVAELASANAAKAGSSEVPFDDLMLALRETQGCKGLNLPEDTLNLDQLTFETELGDKLKQLARRMTKIDQIEAMGGTVPKGVLFYGPPGTGKTAVAKALALSSGWAFMSTTGQRLMSNEKEFENMIEKASDLRPAIIFIDEADDILADRSTNPHGKTATNNLLALLDGDRPLKDVMFIAATNYENTLDAAAVRGGRFAEHFEFVTPGDDALLAIVKSFMAAKSAAPWSPELTPQVATATLSGLSPADAKDRLQQAINRVVARFDDSKITIDDLRAIL